MKKDELNKLVATKLGWTEIYQDIFGTLYGYVREDNDFGPLHFRKLPNYAESMDSIMDVVYYLEDHDIWTAWANVIPSSDEIVYEVKVEGKDGRVIHVDYAPAPAIALAFLKYFKLVTEDEEYEYER